MSRLQKVGLVAFVAFVAFAVTFSYLTKSQFVKMPEKPWHMQPFTDADSLTVEYTGKYELLDKKSLLSRFADSSRVTVAILVDAWGVPFDEHLLAEDFSIFKGLPHKEFLHHRLADRTRPAEFAEVGIPGDSTSPRDGVYLFGGDSLEYGRNLYIDSLGYGVRLFRQKSPDSVMAAKLDSVLAAVVGDTANSVKNIAWTTQDSRDGDRSKLHATLRLIAEVARKHPELRFIVQGTHRPILGDPKIRRESFTHWVPVVIF